MIAVWFVYYFKWCSVSVPFYFTLETKKKNLVLPPPKWTLILLSEILSRMLVQPTFNCFSISLKFFPWETWRELSVYRSRFDFTTCHLCIWQTVKFPKIYFYRTPYVTFERFEQKFSNFTLNNQFERYDLNQSLAWLEKPVFNVILCSIA